MIAKRTFDIVVATIEASLAPMAATGMLVDGVLTDSTSFGGATTNTRFRIASMTKSFTAALTLLLRDEGVLELETPVRDLAPELTPLDAATERAWPAAPTPLTLRHLLTMSSGLPEDDAWADRHLDCSASEFEAMLQTGVFSIFAPGTSYEYSNIGYGSIGRVIERVTGRTAQDLIVERILAPLGMASTGWKVPDADVDWAKPYRKVADGVEIEPHLPGDGVIAPMGGLWSTVEDLARWVRFLSDPTRPGPVSAGSRLEMAAIHTPIMAEANLPLGGGYGMGLTRFFDRIAGPVIGHSGGLPGYGSNMSWQADGSIGIIALANITYARMFSMNRIVMRNLVQSTVSDLGPMGDIGSRLVALLNDWSDVDADALFADNVGPDESFARRRAQASRLVDEHGPFEVVVVEPKHHARATITLLGTRSHRLLTCELSRSPHAEARVQHYRVLEEP